MPPDDLQRSQIPVMMGVELFDASEHHVRLFESAMRGLNWTQFDDHPTTYWTSLQWHPEGDSEILATCKHHLAIAASASNIADFEGTVILGLPEEHWQTLESTTE